MHYLDIISSGHLGQDKIDDVNGNYELFCRK